MLRAQPRPFLRGGTKNKRMRILFLTSKLGLGHLRAAEAVQQALAARDPDLRVQWLDFWQLMERPLAEAIKQIYLRLTGEHPEVYERLYRLELGDWQRTLAEGRLPEALVRLIAELEDGALGGSRRALDRRLGRQLLAAVLRPAVLPPVRRRLIGWARSLLARRALAHIRRFEPDLLIASQVLIPALIAPERRRGRLGEVPVLGVLTDYGVHDLWRRAELDHYCVATAGMAGQLQRQGLSATVTGIPLLPAFARLPEQAAARRALGLPEQGRCVLVTGGQHAIGVGAVLSRLLEQGIDCRLLATDAGGALPAGLPAERVRLFDGEARMPQLLRAADVVVGKPGGLTVSESLACGRPYYATCCLGGQEGFNIAHLERHGTGRRVSLEALGAQLSAVLADDDELTAAQARAAALGRPRAAEAVADAVCQLHDASQREGAWKRA